MPRTVAQIPIAIVALLLFSLSCGPAAGRGDSETDELARELDRLLSTYEQFGFSGAVLVSKQGRILIEEGYGLANRGNGERNTADTLFDFASIAKTFTGAAVLALEADGVLSTDDRLEQHLGPFPESKSSATVQHLATHKAGLAHRTESELDYSLDRATWIQSMKDAPFESVPGASYRYTNAGTSLLAALVEEAAGAPFDEVVRERLFAPAGLESTGFYPEFERGAVGIALGYLDETDTAAPPEYDEWTWGALGSTGIVSTVGDIHAWFQALYGGAILPPEQTAKAFDPEETEAFGWHTETDDQGRAFINKGGGLEAMQTQILAYPDEQVVVVWAHNNMSRNWRRALNRGLSSIALGDPCVLPREIVVAGAVDPELVGSWSTAGGTRLELVETDGGLDVEGNGFGLSPGTLRPGAHGSWISFDIERVSTLVLTPRPDGSLRVDLEPEGERLTLSRQELSEAAFEPLSEPSDEALAFARAVSTWIKQGDADRLSDASVHRPLRGASSRDDWVERIGFISGRVGSEVALIEEAWALREGTWRYWRTFESEAGIQVVLRLGLSADGKVLSYGLNPRGSEPSFDDKRSLP